MQFKVTYEVYSEVYVDAENSKQAIEKARRKLDRKGKFNATRSRQCAGTWRKNCKNEINDLDAYYGGECQSCRYEREEDRINSPG